MPDSVEHTDHLVTALRLDVVAHLRLDLEVHALEREVPRHIASEMTSQRGRALVVPYRLELGLQALVRVSNMHAHLRVQVLVRRTEQVEHVEPHEVNGVTSVAADGVTKGQQRQAGVEEIVHQDVST